MRKLLKHPIIASSFLTIGFTGIVHIANYLYTLVCVRFLTPVEYSDLALIVSFYSLMGVFSATLANTSLSLLSRHKNDEAYSSLKKQILHTSTIVIYAVWIFSLFVLTPIIYYAFKIPSVLEIIIILTAGIFSIGSALLSVHFQLEKDFVRSGFFGVVSTLLKLIFSFIALYAGYKIFGVSVALFFAGLVSFIIFYPQKIIASYNTLLVPKNYFINEAVTFLKAHKRFIFKTLISSLAMILILVIDTLLAKRLLIPNMAAQYIGMATLAKLFFYSTTAICVVIFPYLLSKESQTPKKLLLNMFLGIIFFVGIISLIVSFFFPKELIGLVLGQAYTLEAKDFVYVLLVSITASFASIMTNLSSLLDAAHFNKTILPIFIFGIIFLFVINPASITTLALSLSFIFALLAIVLYNICVKKHL